MTKELERFFRALDNTYDFLNKVHPLTSVWLPTSLITEKERTIRIRKGHRIKVVNGKLEDCIDEPTHEVLECFVAQNPSFSIKVKNIENGKEEIIKLPNF